MCILLVFLTKGLVILFSTFPHWPACHLDFHCSSCCWGDCEVWCEHGGSTHFCVLGRTGGVRHAPSSTFIISVGLISCLHIRSLFWIPSPQVTEHSLHSPATHLQSHCNSQYMLQVWCFILKCNPGSAYYIQYSKKAMSWMAVESKFDSWHK